MCLLIGERNMKIEKLSEENLGDVLGALFPEAKVVHQHRVKINGKTRIIDYAVTTDTETLMVEFDGPTHYTKTSTQLRDIEVAALYKNQLIRFPYFIQPSDDTLCYLFGDERFAKYKMQGVVSAEYQNGFIDKKIVLPGDFNPRGWKLFNALYSDMVVDFSSVSREIYHNAIDNYTMNQFLGAEIDYERRMWWEEYPT